MAELAEKILDRVIQEDCWLWQGCKVDGYGQMKIPGIKRRAYVHRLLYEALRGPVPIGMTLDHICRVRHCVNPDHLRVVTNKENVLAGFGPCAINARKTHCKNGHPFSSENTIVRKDRGHFGRKTLQVVQGNQAMIREEITQAWIEYKSPREVSDNFTRTIDFALAMCERQKERAAMIAQDGNIAPFQPGMLGGDTIPIVMRKHIAAAIRADAPKVEK